MILTSQVTVKINESNYAYYQDLGYDLGIGEDVEIPTSLLSTGSHYKIMCECDFCGLKKEVMFKNYVKYQKDNWGDYNCRKCCEHRRIKSLQNRYGVDYPIQNEELNNKIKNTLIRKYGVDNPNKKREQ